MEPTITQSLQADPKNAETTLRAKVHTGFGCNANCVFCYYHALLRTQNLPVELLNEEVRLARRLGYKDVDFEGGEPTIVPNIEKPISLAKELGFRRISVITNGLALSNEKFYAKLVDAGLNETLFSLHGYPSDVHDSLVRVPGGLSREGRHQIRAVLRGTRGIQKICDEFKDQTS
jgi:MoaA/NifB/PqqE/SkfB family radical SAM enzyme